MCPSGNDNNGISLFIGYWGLANGAIGEFPRVRLRRQLLAANKRRGHPQDLRDFAMLRIEGVKARATAFCLFVGEMVGRHQFTPAQDRQLKRQVRISDQRDRLFRRSR